MVLKNLMLLKFLKEYIKKELLLSYIRVYDNAMPEDIAACVHENGIPVCELRTAKIKLEEYYIDLMEKKEGDRYGTY